MSQSRPIRLLLVEDNLSHAESIKRAFLQAGMKTRIEVVGTLREFRERKAGPAPDVAIMDLNLPDGKAEDVLTSPPEDGPYPILVITSHGDEQIAVSALKSGALDYIVKSSETFAAMPHSVERALREWKLLQERKRVDARLRLAEFSIEHSSVATFLFERTARVVRVNEAACRSLGYSRLEMLAMTVGDFDPDFQEPKKWDDVWNLIKTRKYDLALETRHRRRDGSIFPVEVISSFFEYDGREYIFSFVRDISDRKRAEQELRRKEDYYRSIFDNSLFGIAVTGPDLKFTEVNQSFCRMMESTAEELVGRRGLDDITHPEDVSSSFEQMKALMSHETRHFIVEKRYRTKTGRVIDAIAFVNGLYDADGRYAGHTTSIMDISDRKQTESQREAALAALGESEEKFAKAFRTSPYAITITHVQDGRFIEINQAFTTISGYTREEALADSSIGLNLWVDGEDRKRVVADLREGREVVGKEYRFKKKGGEIMTGLFSAQIIHLNSEPCVLSSINDITDRHKAEEAIQASLREKEVMLREIHHRVKNNMQVISSLFNLQAGHTLSAKCREILKEGQTRIRSMGLIHEKLYQSQDLSKIDLAGYIQSLAVHLFHVYLVNSNQVRLETDFEEVPLDINSAVPCGLLLNELISNALKHGFPDGRAGVIKIGLRRGTGGALELRVADDGVGFPEGLDFRKAESFGLQIVNLLVGQLEATIKLDRTPETVFTVTFRELKYPQRI